MGNGADLRDKGTRKLLYLLIFSARAGSIPFSCGPILLKGTVLIFYLMMTIRLLSRAFRSNFRAKLNLQKSWGSVTQKGTTK